MEDCKYAKDETNLLVLESTRLQTTRDSGPLPIGCATNKDGNGEKLAGVGCIWAY